MERYLKKIINDHFSNNRQMAFLVGPRQVGKTTLCKNISPDIYYFNWDNQDHRLLILEGPNKVARQIGLDQLSAEKKIVVFDEIHKYSQWKTFLKGFFDVYHEQLKIIVTGSARLDVYKKSGDSLMGRYFLYRLHPLTVREITGIPKKLTEEISLPIEISHDQLQELLKLGGFPEPFLKNDQLFYNKWKSLRYQLLFQEDMRELTQIKELGQMETLAYILQSQSGQLTSYNNLAGKIKVSNDTVTRWLQILESMYYCFSVRPWSKNVTRSLLKEPKYYLWDWSVIEDEGARCENFVASHLQKAIHYWHDIGLGDYGLYFLRDKEKREVDFLVTKNNNPWFMIEVKQSRHKRFSKSLVYYSEMLKVSHAFQIVFDMDYINKDCFDIQKPMMVPVQTFLSQLV
jgi:uncharacterized protein